MELLQDALVREIQASLKLPAAKRFEQRRAGRPAAGHVFDHRLASVNRPRNDRDLGTGVSGVARRAVCLKVTRADRFGIESKGGPARPPTILRLQRQGVELANNNGSLDAYVRDFFNVARSVTREKSDAAIGPLSQALWKKTKYSPACAREFLQTAKACTTFAELLAAFKDFLVALKRVLNFDLIGRGKSVSWSDAKKAVPDRCQR